jgi:uncharacterized protein (UPF0261 family)
MAIVLIATLDTKGEEIAFVRSNLEQRGHKTVLIDAGSLGTPSVAPDISRERVFEAAGTTLEAVRERGDRGHAVAMAAAGVAKLVPTLEAEGVFALGGSAGTTIGTSAMRALELGTPKAMVSTLASGQTRPYLGDSDIALFPAVADLAGLNRFTRRILTNAANALAGMVEGGRERAFDSDGASPRPLIAATMFGVTTPCVQRAREVLESAGYEVVVFHATGTGGQAMERLMRQGQVAGVLDLTTTEIADELVGGVLSAGPARLAAGVALRLPQVVSVGAVDMVNFGPVEAVPERFRGRKLHVHNPTVTLMRTTPDENRAIGAFIARALAPAVVPTVALVPRGGVSAIDAPGKPFHDPEADQALFEALEEGLRGLSLVRLEFRDEHINDPAFAEAAANTLLGLLEWTTASRR